MTQSLSSPPVATALLDTPPDSLRLVTCPSCHTTHASLTQQALDAGGEWRCVRCGQNWDARRLQTVAAYAIWAAAHESTAQTGGRFKIINKG